MKKQIIDRIQIARSLRNSHPAALRYGVALLATSVAVLIRLLLTPLLGYEASLMIFTLAVMVAASYGGLAAGLFSTVLSAVAGIYFFGGTPLSFVIERERDVEDVVLLLIVGTLITYMAQALRVARNKAQENLEAVRLAQLETADAYSRAERIAEVLQDSLLLMPAENAFANLAVKSFYEAAKEEARIGGDFCDAFSLRGGEVVLVVGDVTGKGLAAATGVGEIKSVIRAYLDENADPAEALCRLNEFLWNVSRLKDSGSENLVALTLAIVAPFSGETMLAVAGAEPPLIAAAKGGVRSVDIKGSMLRLAPHLTYSAESVVLPPGDLLVMFTDGITDARRGRDFYGYDNLARAVEKARSCGSLQKSGEAILNDVHAFAGGSKLNDDICLLLATRTQGS